MCGTRDSGESQGTRRDMELVNLMDSWGSCVDVWDSQLEQRWAPSRARNRRGTRKSEGLQQTLGATRRTQKTWNSQIQGVATDARHHQGRVELANPRGATNAGRHTMRAKDVELANPRGATNAGRHTMRAEDVKPAREDLLDARRARAEHM